MSVENYHTILFLIFISIFEMIQIWFLILIYNKETISEISFI